jgi:hypothetical protein
MSRHAACDRITTPLGPSVLTVLDSALCVLYGLCVLMCLNFYIWLIFFYLFMLSHGLSCSRMYVGYGWMSSCITSLFVIYRFGMHPHGSFRLGEGVTVYPITFSQYLSLWNHPTLCWVLELVVTGIRTISLPTELPYYIHEGNHYNNKRSFWN